MNRASRIGNCGLIYVVLVITLLYLITITTSTHICDDGPGVLFSNGDGCHCADNFFGPSCTTSYQISFNNLLWRFQKNGISQGVSDETPGLLPLPFDFAHYFAITNTTQPPPSPISSSLSTNSNITSYRIMLVPSWLTYDGTNRVVHANFEQYLINPSGGDINDNFTEENNQNNTINDGYFRNSACGGAIPGENNNIFPSQLYRLGILYGNSITYPLVDHQGQYHENAKVLYIISDVFNIVCMDGRARYLSLLKNTNINTISNNTQQPQYLSGNLQGQQVIAYTPGIARFEPYPVVQKTDFTKYWSTWPYDENQEFVQDGLVCTTEIIEGKISGYFGPGCIFRYETLQVIADTLYEEDQYIPFFFQIVDLDLAKQIFDIESNIINFSVHLNIDDQLVVDDVTTDNVTISIAGGLYIDSFNSTNAEMHQIYYKKISMNATTKQAFINGQIELQIVTQIIPFNNTAIDDDNNVVNQTTHLYLHRHTGITLYKINPVDYINAFVAVNTLGLPSGRGYSAELPFGVGTSNIYPSTISQYLHGAVISLYPKAKTIENGWLPCGPGAVGLNAPFNAWLTMRSDELTLLYPQPCRCTTNDIDNDWFGPYCTYYTPKSNGFILPSRLQHGKTFILKLFSHNSNLRYIKNNNNNNDSIINDRYNTRQCLIRYLITTNNGTQIDVRPPEVCQRIPSIYDMKDTAGMVGYELLIQPHVNFDAMYTQLGDIDYPLFAAEMDSLLNPPIDNHTDTTYGLDIKIAIDFWSPNGEQQKEIKIVKLYSPTTINHVDLNTLGVGSKSTDTSVASVCLPPYIGSDCSIRIDTDNNNIITRNWALHSHLLGIFQSYGTLTNDLTAAQPTSSYRIGNLGADESSKILFRIYNNTIISSTTPSSSSTPLTPNTPSYALPTTPAILTTPWLYNNNYINLPPPTLDGTTQRITYQTAAYGIEEEVPYFIPFEININDDDDNNENEFPIIWSQLIQAMPYRYDNISRQAYQLNEECPKNRGEKRLITTTPNQTPLTNPVSICFCKVVSISNLQYYQEQQSVNNNTNINNNDINWDNNPDDLYQQIYYFGSNCQYSLTFGYHGHQLDGNEQPQLINGQRHGIVVNLQWDMRYDMQHIVHSIYNQSGGTNNNFLLSNRNIILNKIFNNQTTSLSSPSAAFQLFNRGTLQNQIRLYSGVWTSEQSTIMTSLLNIHIGPSSSYSTSTKILTQQQQLHWNLQQYADHYFISKSRHHPYHYIQDIQLWISGYTRSLWLSHLWTLRLTLPSVSLLSGVTGTTTNDTSIIIKNTNEPLIINIALPFKKNLQVLDYQSMYSPAFAQNPGDLYGCGRDENAFLLLWKQTNGDPSSNPAELSTTSQWVDIPSVYYLLSQMGYNYNDIGYIIDYTIDNNNNNQRIDSGRNNKGYRAFSNVNNILNINNQRSNIIRSLIYANSTLSYIQTDVYHNINETVYYNKNNLARGYGPIYDKSHRFSYIFESPDYCLTLKTANNYNLLKVQTTTTIPQSLSWTSDLPLSHCPQPGRFGTTCQYGIRMYSNDNSTNYHELQIPLTYEHYMIIRSWNPTTQQQPLYVNSIHGSIVHYYFDHPPEYYYVNVNDNNTAKYKNGISNQNTHIVPIAGCKLWFWYKQQNWNAYNKFYAGDCSNTLPRLYNNNTNNTTTIIQPPKHSTFIIPHSAFDGPAHLIIEYIGPNERYIKPKTQLEYQIQQLTPEATLLDAGRHQSQLRPTYYNTSPNNNGMYTGYLEEGLHPKHCKDLLYAVGSNPYPNMSTKCHYIIKRKINRNNYQSLDLFPYYHTEIKNLPFVYYILDHFVYRGENDAQYQIVRNLGHIGTEDEYNEDPIPCKFETSSNNNDNIQQPNNLTQCYSTILQTNGTAIEGNVYSFGVYGSTPSQTGLFYTYNTNLNQSVSNSNGDNNNYNNNSIITYELNKPNLVTLSFTIPPTWQQYTTTPVGQLEHIPLPVIVVSPQQYLLEFIRLFSFQQVSKIHWCYHDKIKSLNLTKFFMNPYTIPLTYTSYTSGNRPFQPQQGAAGVNDYCECLDDVAHCRMQQCPTNSKRNFTNWYFPPGKYDYDNPYNHEWPRFDVELVPIRALTWDALPQCECNSGYRPVYADQYGNVPGYVYKQHNDDGNGDDNHDDNHHNSQRTGYLPGELIECVRIYNPTYCPNINERIFYHRYSKWINNPDEKKQQNDENDHENENNDAIINRNLHSKNLLSLYQNNSEIYASCEFTNWLSFTWRPTHVVPQPLQQLQQQYKQINPITNQPFTTIKANELLNSIGTYKIWKPEQQPFYVYNVSDVEVNTWWNTQFLSKTFYEKVWDSMWPMWPWSQGSIPSPQNFPSKMYIQGLGDVDVENNNNNNQHEILSNNLLNTNTIQQQPETYQKHPYWHPSSSQTLKHYHEYNLEEMSWFFKINPSWFSFYKIDTFKQVSFTDNQQPDDGRNGDPVYFNTTGPNGRTFFIDLQYYPEISPGVYSKSAISLWSSDINIEVLLNNTNNVTNPYGVIMGITSGDGVLGNIVTTSSNDNNNNNNTFQPRVNITTYSTHPDATYDDPINNQELTVDLLTSNHLINPIADLDDLLNDLIINGENSKFIKTQQEQIQNQQQTSIKTIEELQTFYNNINNANANNSYIPEDLYFYIQNLDLSHTSRPRHNQPGDTNANPTDPYDGTYQFDTNPPLTFNINSTVSTCFWSIYVRDRSTFVPLASTQPFAVQFRTACDGSRDGVGGNLDHIPEGVDISNLPRCPMDGPTVPLSLPLSMLSLHYIEGQGVNLKDIQFVEDQILEKEEDGHKTNIRQQQQRSTDQTINNIDTNNIQTLVSNNNNIHNNLFLQQFNQIQQQQHQDNEQICNPITGMCLYDCMPHCDAIGTESCTSTPFIAKCHCKPQYTGPRCETELFCTRQSCLNGGWYKIDPIEPKLPDGTLNCLYNQGCVCPSDTFWRSGPGQRCTSCIIQCHNQGTPYRTCKHCTCRPGFNGQFCECRSMTGTLVVPGLASDVVLLWLEQEIENIFPQSLDDDDSVVDVEDNNEQFKSLAFNYNNDNNGDDVGIKTYRKINTYNNNNNSTPNNNKHQKEILKKMYTRMLYVLKTFILDAMGVNNNSHVSPITEGDSNPNNGHNQNRPSRQRVNNYIKERNKNKQQKSISIDDTSSSSAISSLTPINDSHHQRLINPALDHNILQDHNDDINNEDFNIINNTSTRLSNLGIELGLNSIMLDVPIYTNHTQPFISQYTIDGSDKIEVNNNILYTYNKPEEKQNINNTNFDNDNINHNNNNFETTSTPTIDIRYLVDATEIVVTFKYGCPGHAQHATETDMRLAWSQLVDNFSFYLSQAQHREVFNYFYYIPTTTTTSNDDDDNNSVVPATTTPTPGTLLSNDVGDANTNINITNDDVNINQENINKSTMLIIEELQTTLANDDGKTNASNNINTLFASAFILLIASIIVLLC